MDLAAWTPRALSVLRIMTGLLFLEHGTGKLLGFPSSGRLSNRALVLEAFDTRFNRKDFARPSRERFHASKQIPARPT